MKITVLGAGMVGRAMALDLAWNHEVTVLDFSEANLTALRKRNDMIQTFHADLRQKEHFADWLSRLVLIAVPGFMGFETVKAVIEIVRTLLIFLLPENTELDICKTEELRVTVR
jgi:saccharopine dehydrogenase-like NADP-dependent oxidoreductase